MVDKLREHLNRHLSRLGKKKIDLLVVNYAAKLVCVCTLTSLRQRPLEEHVLSIGNYGTSLLYRHKTMLNQAHTIRLKPVALFCVKSVTSLQQKFPY